MWALPRSHCTPRNYLQSCAIHVLHTPILSCCHSTKSCHSLGQWPLESVWKGFTQPYTLLLYVYTNHKLPHLMALHNHNHWLPSNDFMHLLMWCPKVRRMGNPGDSDKIYFSIPGVSEMALLTLGNSDITFCNK